MLEPPDLAEVALVEYVRRGWGLVAADLRFMPVGYDAFAWAYELRSEPGERYFLKLRRGETDLAAAVLTRHLHDLGLHQVVAALSTPDGNAWYRADGFELLLYPFITGRSASALGLTDEQWREYGAFLRQLHRVDLPPEVASLVAEERYTCPEAAGVRALAECLGDGGFTDPAQRELAEFWRAHEAEIAELADRVEQLGRLARAQRLRTVLCHADIHAGNIVIGDGGRLFVVDWDAPLLAPAERDLMFVVGATVTGVPITPAQETLFWRGYGDIELNWPALAYYRYQRVVEDLDAFGREVLLRNDLGPQTKAESLRWFRHQFAAGGPVEIARGTEQ